MYIIKWDSVTESGYVVNEVYPKGYVFEGVAQKPVLGFEYEDITFDEIHNLFEAVVNGKVVVLTTSQQTQVKEAVMMWVDTTYVSAEQTLEIHRANTVLAISDRFDYLVSQLAPHTSSHEMASWATQEAEAIAYSNDTSAPTPLLSELVLSRDVGETLSTLVDLVLLKAQAYRLAYGKLLGRSHKLLKIIEGATTKEELQAVVW